MELLAKYQYTYFICPYVIDSSKYSKYIGGLLKNKKYSLRIFEKEKDLHLYNYFLPSMKKYMFWSLNFSKEGLKNFNKLDEASKVKVLLDNDCNIFQYELPKDLQGKIGQKDGIFFDINEIKIVCFKTGICFLVMKTSVVNNNSFENILNFNYKFREINSETYSLKEFENIKLQSDIFQDVQEVSTLIKGIIGSSILTKKLNINNEKLITYSYCCLDQNSWNEETSKELIDNVFEKYRLFSPANAQIDDIVKEKDSAQIQESKYVRYGLSNTGTVLLTSDINTTNYTTLAQKFESEYLYTYILQLYKKMLLKKLNIEFNKTSSFKNAQKNFLEFAKKIWIQEITDEETGKILSEKWAKNLDIEDIFFKLKTKYDIFYKKYNIEESSNKNGKFAIIMIILIIISVINLLLQLGK